MIVRTFRDFLEREDGPTAVEYAVMLALIVVVCSAAISALGGNAAGTFEYVSSKTNSGIPIGGTATGGTAVDSGTFSVTEGRNQLSYNAATGETTETHTRRNGETRTFSFDSGAGTLPGSSSTVWTRTE